MDMALDYTSDVLFDFRNFLLWTLLFCHHIPKLQGLGDTKRKEILEVYHQLYFSCPCSVPPWDN